MNRSTLVPALASIALVAGLAGAAAAQSGYSRPLSDFLGTQGATVGLTPPVADYLSFTDPARGRLISVDYAGIADAWTRAQSGGSVSYGTEITGTVTETPRADGRANVQIIVHAHHALTYVVAFDAVNGPDYSQVKFGNLAPAALASGDAALGDCNFQIRIINPAPHAPIPDLFDAFINGNGDPNLGLTFISFNCSATGTLHAGAIDGVPEGTPGRASTAQAGLFMTGHPVGDGGFPVENIRLSAH